MTLRVYVKKHAVERRKTTLKQLPDEIFRGFRGKTVHPRDSPTSKYQKINQFSPRMSFLTIRDKTNRKPKL